MTQDNPRMGDLNELVERLGTPHTLDIRDIVQVRALLDLVAVERSEAAAAITSLIAERDGLREALKPFAMQGWADENGWTDRGCPNDRICDWFGPSDFATALSPDTNKGDGV